MSGRQVERDAAFVDRLMPVLDLVLPYFDPEIERFDRVPAKGPMLIVGNHSGGMYMPDFWAFLRHWVRERPRDPLYALGLDFLFALPVIGNLARRTGAVPANHLNAERLLGEGAAVLVYPGGAEECYRPWTDRHRVDLRGHTGFVRLALHEQVPVVPLVTQGSHDSIVVLSRGTRLARRVGLDRLRISVLPLVAGPPWGVAPVPIPTWPLPTKIIVRVGEPIDWTPLGPTAADNPTLVRACYDQVLSRMQADLDELVAEDPHPILARMKDPTRQGSERRHDRP